MPKTAAHVPEVPLVSSIFEKAPAKQWDPKDPNSPKPPAGSKMLGGLYRVIHGRVIVPAAPESYLKADGSDDPFKSKTVTAELGDVLLLGHADAERLLDRDIVEPLDARPSRVGKVWNPPKASATFFGISSPSSVGH